ncbi:NADP-dependent dehydrogenase [Parachaetomium inaequale]|uniref:NADP-dependent dehydrogenase n=1 Tax=Parachaetomium inaequale TaxID=2588326 RepID=A0AAN6SRZ8_9PEZI|nr:NADP-dependent dehydrogenase [Parachaetomium inaequale]
MPVYVVTGCRRGIGLEYIRHLSQTPGNTVFALVRSQTGDLTALQSVRESAAATVHILDCDISSAASIAGLPSRIAQAASPDIKIDVLINNAGILHSRAETALTMSPDDLLSHVQSNVIGPALMLQTLLPHLSPTARVANITSGIGSLALLAAGRIPVEATAYSVSKTALNMLTVHQQAQLKAQGSEVVVVTIDPGHVKTEMGGPHAVVEPEDSVKGVLGVLGRVGAEEGGRFWAYDGGEVPW